MTENSEISLLPEFSEKSIFYLKSQKTKKRKNPKIVSIDLRGLSNYKRNENFHDFKKRINPPMIFSSKKRKEFDFKIVKNCQKKKIYNDFQKSMGTYDFNNRRDRKVRVEVGRLTENCLRKFEF